MNIPAPRSEFQAAAETPQQRAARAVYESAAAAARFWINAAAKGRCSPCMAVISRQARAAARDAWLATHR